MNLEKPLETMENKVLSAEKEDKLKKARENILPPAVEIGRILKANIKEIL